MPPVAMDRVSPWSDLRSTRNLQPLWTGHQLRAFELFAKVDLTVNVSYLYPFWLPYLFFLLAQIFQSCFSDSDTNHRCVCCLVSTKIYAYKLCFLRCNKTDHFRHCVCSTFGQSGRFIGAGIAIICLSLLLLLLFLLRPPPTLLLFNFTQGLRFHIDIRA